MNYTTYEVRVYENGTKRWYLNGKQHKEDGPAVVWASGEKYWYLNGKLHNENGPAIEWRDGTKQWWLHGKRLTKQEWQKQTGNRLGRSAQEGNRG